MLENLQLRFLKCSMDNRFKGNIENFNPLLHFFNIKLCGCSEKILREARINSCLLVTSELKFSENMPSVHLV
jgi:hypothetical protein